MRRDGGVTLSTDLRHSLRALAARPFFTAAVVGTLALGVGVNAALLPVVRAVVLQPLPFAAPGRLVAVFEQRPAPVGRTRLSSDGFLDVRTAVQAMADLATFAGVGRTITGDGEPEFVVSQMVSANLFDVLQARPLLGRTFASGEDTGGRDRVAVLSYGLWQRRYGGAVDILGRAITLNGLPHEIVGVMPAAFAFPSADYALWTPFAFRDNAMGMAGRNARFLRVVGRLRDGADSATLRASLGAAGTALAAAYPREHGDGTFDLTSLAEELVGDVRPAVTLLWAAVGALLLIACANVTNLLLARATGRRREIAVRLALGATRARIVREVLIETLLCYAAAAVAGLGLAWWALDAVVRLAPPDLPGLDGVAIDGFTVALTAGIALATGLAFGVGPALHAARRDPSADASPGAPRAVADGRATERVRGVLVGVEVALALTLVVGAGLAVRTLQQLGAVDPGLRADDALTFDLVPPEARYVGGADVARFHGAVVDTLRDIPGVEAVGATTHLPLSGQDFENAVTPDGWTPPTPDSRAVAGVRGVAGDFVAAAGLHLLAGRAITAADDATRPPVVLVNASFVARYWPGAAGVGRRVKFDDRDGPGPWLEVVGVYADVAHRGLDAVRRPELLVPQAQADPELVRRWFRGMSIVVRSGLAVDALMPDIRLRVRGLDDHVPIIRPRTMPALVGAAAGPQRFRGVLLAIFAALAVALAAVGIAGVVASLVARRTRELGVRVALGAAPRDVLGAVVGWVGPAVALGGVAGIGGGLAVGRAMRALLFQVQPLDVTTWIAAALMLLAAAGAAVLLPARRALAVDPLSSLRGD